jgi:hypothetical protein
MGSQDGCFKHSFRYLYLFIFLLLRFILIIYSHSRPQQVRRNQKSIAVSRNTMTFQLNEISCSPKIVGTKFFPARLL